MNPELDLRLRVTAGHLTIAARGHLTAFTAHLLPKVVIGTLRRYPAHAMTIDLTDVQSTDFVGHLALRDCVRVAGRHGVTLTFDRPPAARQRTCRTPTLTRQPSHSHGD